MHSIHLTASRSNTYGEPNDVLPGDVFNFHFNSDLSGEVIVENIRPTDTPPGFKPVSQIVIPAWMLKEFIGRWLNGEIISDLERKSGIDTLELLRI